MHLRKAGVNKLVVTEITARPAEAVIHEIKVENQLTQLLG
jgi:hypothetical protein